MKQADIDRIWYGAEPVPLWMRLLVPVYRMLRAVVGLAWRSGLRKPTRLGVPVIVVGNITAGGTGKTPVGATLAAAETMLHVIATQPRESRQVGLKISGGLRAVAELLPYLELVRRTLGPGALQPQRFRIGASSLLDAIEAVLGGAPIPPPPTSGY